MSGIRFRTSELSVGYNGKPLISDIEIDLEPGEILTLIGPNGSGKSTILKSITKHLSMIGGDAFIGDASVRAMSYREMARRLSVVLTERIKGELLTCYDVVAAGRYPYTGSLGILSAGDRRKVMEAMERVNAAELAGRDFLAVSDGQRQRVLLARALCQEPQVIVLDEPTSFLDIHFKLELLNILQSMSRSRSITVIMSLHELDLAQKISDKVLCVKGDHITSFGRPGDIFCPRVIDELYGLPAGAYDIVFGSVELAAPRGEANTFIISACGSGIPYFRACQREGLPFYAGIIYKNDIDYRVASGLAAEVVCAEPFAPIGQEAFERALELMGRCDRVINAGFPDGEYSKKLRELTEAAEKTGRLVSWQL